MTGQSDSDSHTLLQKVIRAIPNALTTLRFILALWFPFFSPPALPLVAAVAMITEFLDGYLSRRWNAVTRFGAIFDPIADKVFVLAVALTIVKYEWAPVWQVVLVLFRDIMVGLVVFVHIVINRNTEAKWEPRFLGKAATAVQFIFFFVILVMKSTVFGLFCVAAVLSILSAIDYGRSALKLRFRMNPARS